MFHPILAQAADNATGLVAQTMSRGEELLQSAYRWLTENGLRFATSLVAALLIYIIGSWLAGLVRKMLLRVMGARGLDPTFSGYLANVVHGILIVMVVISAMGQVGIPTAQFAALIAAAGLAIGLALQGNLSNFASGFLLVFFRPFKRGDYLTAGGAEGSVEEIGIFTTTLHTLDNRKVVVPNSSITGGNITNFSSNPLRGVAVPCTVGGGNPMAAVRAALLESVKGNTLVVAEPAPVVVLTQLGENKFTVELRASCAAAVYWDALFTMNEAAKAALERHNIAGPLPAMRVLQG
jgi:small conductance mechanosensitive channel